MGSTRLSFYWRRLSVPLLATSVAAVALGIAPTLAQAETVNYSTAGTQTFAVPANVDQVTVSATGARGGLGGDAESCIPGKGGQLQATFSVTPGSTLSVAVGGQGGDTTIAAGGEGGIGGGAAGGTGDGGLGGGGGGGASTVALSSGARCL
jgi:hypothetical protein